MIEFYSFGDLIQWYAKWGRAGLVLAQGHARRERARNAVLLGVLLHKTNAETYSLKHEFTNIVRRHADPNAASIERSYIYTMGHFVATYLLPGWVSTVDEREEASGLVKIAADDFLLEVAKANKVPLITNDGNSHQGTPKQGSIFLKGPERGVKVMSAGGFIGTKLDANQAIKELMALMTHLGPLWANTRQFPDNANDCVQAIMTNFGHVFFDWPWAPFENEATK